MVEEAKASTLYTDEDLDDILVAAVEGGINYWANVVQWAPTEASALIECEEGEYSLNRETVRLGLDRLGDASFEVGGIVRDAVLSGEAGDIDAGAADCVIQAALFNEIVYG